MLTQELQLKFLPQYNAFGIADEEIEKLSKENITPIISLKKSDYKKLRSPIPSKHNPTVAFLMGRETGFYTIDYNYAKAIAQSGVNIRFLTYKENISQLHNIDGLILPGGSFNSPNEFYTDPLKPTDNQPGTRSYAYISSIIEAEKKHIPILGICAGAQMIGGMHGLKMYRNLKEYTNTQLEHKASNLDAHEVNISPNSPLYKIIGRKNIITNSRHKEALLNFDRTSDLTIYATSNDGTPEAWGNEEKNILCIQWHPEDFAAKGDKTMQNIYNWIANKAHIHQKQKELKHLKKQNMLYFNQQERH